ncbi:MAG TPA: patatin-like phospholipase family protein [Candidatus Binataceae bacterium]|nr:patatin-like phospholipase family protein [Candidatus Binataceae bacterium]
MAKRALVLGGGGPVGIAWEAGLLAGLAEGGVDLSDADFIVGTSAGSFVGAQIAMGKAPGALAAPILAESAPAPESRPSSDRPAGPPPDLTMLITKMAEAASGKRPAREVRAEIGKWALEAKTMSEEAFIAGFGRSFNELPDDTWPERNYACTAVDALTGEFVVWNKEAGAGIKRAVASSCSVPGVFPPITIKGRRYIDGGMRSATNADLAKGYDVAIVVAVTGAATDKISEQFRKQLDKEIAVARESGTKVELIVPDAASLQAFGINLMDPRKRPGAAKAGLAQGNAQASSLRAAWKA